MRTKQPESVVSTPISSGVFPNLKPFTTTVAPCGRESMDNCRENKSLSSELHAASKMPAKKHEIDAVFFIFLPCFTPKKTLFCLFSTLFWGFYFCFFEWILGTLGCLGYCRCRLGGCFYADYAPTNVRTANDNATTAVESRTIVCLVPEVGVKEHSPESRGSTIARIQPK